MSRRSTLIPATASVALLSLWIMGAGEADRIDRLYDLSMHYEQSKNLPAALATAQKILDTAGETYSIRLRLGWLNLNMDNPAKAALHYERATALQPESEEAWLGAERAAAQSGRFEDAARAGDRTLEINPDNRFAVSWLAYAKFMLEDWEAAEMLYRRAVENDPENGELMLGLGFTLARLGKPNQGQAWCERAAVSLGEDPRVDQCLKESKAARVAFSTSLYGSYLAYTDQWNLRDIKSLTASFGATWPIGVTLWVGANLSETVLNYQKDDYWQANPVVGLQYRRKGLVAKGAFSWLFTNAAETTHTPVGILGIGYDGKVIGGGLDAAGSFYPSLHVFQIDPGLRFFIKDKLRISLRPELIVLSSPGTGRGNQRSADTELLASGHLELTYFPDEIAAVYVSGFYGPLAYAVEADGLSIWSNDDRFIGGYRIGAVVRAHEIISIAAEFRHGFATEQEGISHRFAVIGGLLGLLFHY